MRRIGNDTLMSTGFREILRSLVALTASLLLFLLTPASAAGAAQQQLSVPDPPGATLRLVVWYPSAGVPTRQSVGAFHPNVAIGAPIEGHRLPLVVISHGTGGSAYSHYDTAIALADAGFVVVSLNHTGDNHADQSRTGSRINLIDRPRQLRRVIDYMLNEWPERARLDADRIGMFGFSLGGFATLVSIGGVPELSRTRQLCLENPSAPDCAFVRSHGGDPLDAEPTSPPNWAHDPRIKAAVIAAPAASYVFGPGSLTKVSVPVQLWAAANDQDAPARWNSDVVEHGLPPSTETHVVPRAGHRVFLTPEICDPGVASFDCETFHEQLNAAIVEFFGSHLQQR
jgi:predicted dienelactone hydrolase